MQQSNFGDTISPFIVEKLSGRPVAWSDGEAKLLAVGSIFWIAKPRDTVWGTGMTSHDAWNIPPKNIDIRAVRGPLTRQKLLDNGIFCPPVYGDPGLLMPQLYPATPKPKRKWGLIPHIDSIAQYAHYKDQLIDVRWPWQRVIDEILQCEFVISSSLHGIIIAEAYGIPALWLATNIHRFKFDDYYAATNRRMNPAASVEEALQTPPNKYIPSLDLHPLLNAFPYKTT